MKNFIQNYRNRLTNEFIYYYFLWIFFFQAEDGIRNQPRSRGLGDVYKRQILERSKSHRMKKFIELDLIENPDLAQTIIVTSLGLSIHTKLTGLNTLKIKETDRLVALKNEISKFNTDVIIDDQSIEIKSFPKVLPENIEIDTYHDHRMALAFSPLSVLVKLVINDYGVISKSFPEYWTILQKLNFDLEFDN